jgi:hypothetical protein
MPQFNFYIDKKVTLWNREYYSVSAKNIKEATKIITKNFKSPDSISDENIECTNYESLYDTEEIVPVEKNDGNPTMELRTGYGKKIADNASK